MGERPVAEDAWPSRGHAPGASTERDAPTFRNRVRLFDRVRPPSAKSAAWRFDPDAYRDRRPWHAGFVGIGRRLGRDTESRAQPGGRKIGSASCRERVCQYVYISTVSVTLKKKNIL